MYPIVDAKYLESRYRWLNLYPNENPASNPFNVPKTDSIYFRIAPQLLDWAVLIMMNLLQIVNAMYTNKTAIVKLEEKIGSGLKDQFGKMAYYFSRVERIVKSLLIYSLLFFMIYVTQTIEVNLINWIFFILNNINLF